MLSSLKSRITFAGSLLGLLLVFGFGFVSFKVIDNLIQIQLNKSLEYSSQRLSDHIANRLNYLFNHQSDLAANTLIGNALVDDFGRERYLPTFLDDIQQVADIPVDIFVTNFLGEVIAKNSSKNKKFFKENIIADLVNANRSQAQVVSRDNKSSILVLVRPIIFANTGLAEGALIYQIPLSGILHSKIIRETWNSDAIVRGIEFILLINELEPIRLHAGLGFFKGMPQVSVPVFLRSDFNLKAILSTGANPHPFKLAQQELLEHYLLIAFFSLVLIYLISRLFSHHLTHCLRHLQNQAESIISSGSFSQRMSIRGEIEVVHLATAFNSVLDQLEQAFNRLEQQSREALRRKEEKYRAVVEQVGEALLLFSTQLRIIEANPSAMSLLGRDGKQLLGQSLKQLLPKTYHYLLNTQNAQERTFEAELKHADGTRIIVEINSGSVEIDNETYCLWLMHDISERKAAQAALLEKQQQLETLAYHDALTHLPNRYLFTDRVQQAIAHSRRRGTLLAICYLDLDGFKEVNDQAGHKVGDTLLINVAKRLTNILRSEDTVARLGGDEFVILLGELHTREQGAEILQRMLTSLSLPHLINGDSHVVSASIGVTFFPEDDADVDTLLRHSDQAMYMAKLQGRNRFYFFDLEGDRQNLVRQNLRQELENAITHNELRLYYQPKVNMREGKVFGVEALVRWEHQQRGLLSPDHFLPLIREQEAQQQLDWWVLRQGLAQLALWHKQGLDLQMSLNVTAQTVQEPHFISRLKNLLAEHPRLHPNSVELELLESEAVSDLENVSSVIHECAVELGVSFALDDFGTGYSSLTYYRHLPAKVLKMDRSFVISMLHDGEDLNIVEGVIGLARAFDRRVIAEGVESIAHGLLLLRLGCDLAQGYGIAAPLPSEQIAAWVKEYQPPKLWMSASSHQWSLEDLPLLTVEVHHRHWVKQVIMQSKGEFLPSPPAVHDHHQCRFGRWYYGLGMRRYGHLSSFKKLATRHQQIHQLALSMLAKDNPSAKELEDSEKELLLARDELLENLYILQEEVLANSAREA